MKIVVSILLITSLITVGNATSKFYPSGNYALYNNFQINLKCKAFNIYGLGNMKQGQLKIFKYPFITFA